MVSEGIEKTLSATVDEGWIRLGCAVRRVPWDSWLSMSLSDILKHVPFAHAQKKVSFKSQNYASIMLHAQSKCYKILQQNYASIKFACLPMALYTGQQSLHKTVYTAQQRHVDTFPDHTFYVSRPHLLCIKNRIEDRQSKIDNWKSTIESKIDNRIENRKS